MSETDCRPRLHFSALSGDLIDNLAVLSPSSSPPPVSPSARAPGVLSSRSYLSQVIDES